MKYFPVDDATLALLRRHGHASYVVRMYPATTEVDGGVLHDVADYDWTTGRPDAWDWSVRSLHLHVPHVSGETVHRMYCRWPVDSRLYVQGMLQVEVKSVIPELVRSAWCWNIHLQVML